ncbi:hypothetical protein J2Y67_002878 [Neobacillus niacini]|nr:hypothetical protein [Neobacillus niacini]
MLEPSYVLGKKENSLPDQKGKNNKTCKYCNKWSKNDVKNKTLCSSECKKVLTSKAIENTIQAPGNNEKVKRCDP